LRLDVKTRHPDGVIIKVPLTDRTVQAVTAHGRPAGFSTEERFSQRWLLVVVPAGKSRVECRW